MDALAFLTIQHVTGVILVLSVVSGLGAYPYTLVRDKGGPMIFGQPPREWLRLIHEHPRAWSIGTLAFMSATLGTTLGLALLAVLLRDAGDPGFSVVGIVAYAIGIVLWVFVLASRLSVDFWAGKALAASGAVPEAYSLLSTLNSALFTTFTILAFAGAIGLGGAILATALLPQWLGWATIIYSLGGLILLAIRHDALPALHGVMPLVIGIMLLLA